MHSLKVALFAGAAFAAAFTSANAADLGPIMQAPQTIAPVQVEQMPAAGICAATSASARRRFTDFDHTRPTPAFVWPASWRIDQRDIGDAAFVGGGVGYPVEFVAALRRDR